ncbi:MAG: hypothetical protein GEU80_11155 [Dehalococcoidia bacterium]|nr:hypothetical protein [Dehalococcoidia bacterium]
MRVRAPTRPAAIRSRVAHACWTNVVDHESHRESPGAQGRRSIRDSIEEAIVFCPQCGSAAFDADRFCRVCGRSLAAPDSGGAAPAVHVAEPPVAASLSPDAPRAQLVRRQGSVIVTASGTREIAGFGVRLGGILIDVVVYYLVTLAITLVAYAADVADPDEAAAYVWMPALFVAVWVFNAVGWSPGKRAVGLRVITDSGGPPGPGGGLARALGAIVSGLAVGLGFLWAAWDDRRQTWHDKMASTYVVRTQKDGGGGPLAPQAGVTFHEK